MYKGVFLVVGDVRAAYRAAVSRLKQDFDQRLVEAELRFMHRATHATSETYTPYCQPSCTSYGCAGNTHAAQEAGSTTTNDITKQLNELQVNLNDQVRSIQLPV